MKTYLHLLFFAAMVIASCDKPDTVDSATFNKRVRYPSVSPYGMRNILVMEDTTFINYSEEHVGLEAVLGYTATLTVKISKADTIKGRYSDPWSFGYSIGWLIEDYDPKNRTQNLIAGPRSDTLYYGDNQVAIFFDALGLYRLDYYENLNVINRTKYVVVTQ